MSHIDASFDFSRLNHKYLCFLIADGAKKGFPVAWVFSSTESKQAEFDACQEINRMYRRYIRGVDADGVVVPGFDAARAQAGLTLPLVENFAPAYIMKDGSGVCQGIEQHNVAIGAVIPVRLMCYPHVKRLFEKKAAAFIMLDPDAWKWLRGLLWFTHMSPGRGAT